MSGGQVGHGAVSAFVPNGSRFVPRESPRSAPCSPQARPVTLTVDRGFESRGADMTSACRPTIRTRLAGVEWRRRRYRSGLSPADVERRIGANPGAISELEA